MYKNHIVFFFLILFFSSIVSPSVVSMLDTTYDISLMEKPGEEKENNKEEVKDIEITLYYSFYDTSLSFITKKTKSLNYYFKAYNSLSKKLFLPPPEQIII
jgi:hypothetical protein